MLHLLHITVVQQQSQLQVNGFPISDLLAVFALVVAGFAAWQAAKSAQATAQANVQAVLPVLTLRYVPEPGKLGGYVVIRNTGQGQAFHIRIPKYRRYFYEPKMPNFTSMTELKLRAIPDDLLPDQERRLTADESESGQPVTGRGFITMIVMGGRKRLRVPIRYEDVSGNGYITYVETGRDYVRIVRPSRHFKLVEGLRYHCRYSLYYFAKDRTLWIRHLIRKAQQK